MDNDRITQGLNELIQANIDSEKTFQSAVDDVHSDELKVLMEALRKQRADFVSALRTLVRRVNGEPEEEGHPGAGVKRGWQTIKAAMTIERDKTDQVVLEECASQEKAILKSYRELLDRQIPAYIEDEIREQYEYIQAAYEQLNRLADEVVPGDR